MYGEWSKRKTESTLKAKVHHVFLTKRYILILTTLCTDGPTALVLRRTNRSSLLLYARLGVT